MQYKARLLTLFLMLAIFTAGLLISSKDVLAQESTAEATTEPDATAEATSEATAEATPEIKEDAAGEAQTIASEPEVEENEGPQGISLGILLLGIGAVVIVGGYYMMQGLSRSSDSQ